MNSSDATSTISATGKKKWNFLNPPTASNSRRHPKVAASSIAAMPVDMADTRKRIGSSALFHKGNVFATPSRQPV